jgi:hypothetical protein
MRAHYCTLGELHTTLSLDDVADAFDFTIAADEADDELRKRAAARAGKRD